MTACQNPECARLRAEIRAALLQAEADLKQRRATGGPPPPYTCTPRDNRKDHAMAGDIRDLQAQVNAWVEHNFGHDNELATVGGLAEEVGEVMRAAVKRSQGIRGTREEWDTELRKECADVFIKLCDVASFYGFDLSDAIAERWMVVGARDWRANPQGHGIKGAA